MIYSTTTGEYYASHPKPTAFITKGKQRVKQYSESVYLNDGDEFEIELFNPTHKTILAKIKINGEYLSTSGLILKPGQRLFLERFIDVDKKFIYSTYEVNGNDSEVKEAIKLNGNVEIQFFNQITTNWTTSVGTISSGTTTTTLGNYTTTSTTHTSTPYWDNIGNSVNLTSSTPTSNLNQFTTTNLNTNVSMETGRIEGGKNSNQSLIQNNNFNFEWFSFHIVNWKILPNSQKPIEISDLKRYCHSCGSKIKKSTYKFCPNCGEKLD
jgi:hypothetical protein